MTPAVSNLLTGSEVRFGAAGWLTLPGVYQAFLVVSLLPHLAMFFFRRWGRTLGVTVLVFITFVALFSGVNTSAPLDAFVGSVSNTLNVMVLVIAYLPPIKNYFGGRPWAGSDDQPDEMGEFVRDGVSSAQPDAELVEILRTGDESLLLLLHSLFREHDVEFTVVGDNLQDLFAAGRLGGHNFAIGPARVFVRDTDVDRAKAVLEQIMDASPPSDSGIH